ncbi:MAG: cytidine deaminase [Clostridiales bacterium]|nr:cytidine deaminase [Clostridiales bacterium]
MKDKLLDNLKNSYSPYSDFKVSAAVVMNDGREFFGVNIENASYGATICAERCAIFKAVSEGYGKGDFKELHLMVGSGKIGMPCFMCRQVITEFFGQDKKIFCYQTDGTYETYTVSELCPRPFGPDDL